MAKANKQLQKHTMPVVLRIMLSMVFLFLMSVIFVWFIEWRSFSCDVEETWNFVTDHNLIFWYDVVIIFFVLATLSAILWRPFLATGIFFAVISAITYAHIQKIKYRDTPLLPEDFLLADQAGGLMQFVDQWEVIRLVLGIIFIILGAFLLDYYARKVIGRNQTNSPWWERWALIPRMTLTVIALTGLVLSTNFLLHREDLEDADDPKFEWLDTTFTAWNQETNYRDNGFLLGFLYNLGQMNMPAPNGYSEEKILSIAQKYEEMKKADTEREPLDKIVDNVIVILDETFYDPELLNEYYSHTGGDLLPVLHALFEDTPSGYMYSPEYGGGTANVEFEAFTSLSNFWSGRMQYITSIPKLTTLMSVASWTKQFGFDTNAIHAYDGSMYKRYIVYPKMGYDELMFEDDFVDPERENVFGYITDRQVYQEILRIARQNDGHQMISAVTMQNHPPYEVAWYDQLDFMTSDELLSYNFQSLHNADAYLGEFLEELEDLDEKTVVLWFGDHAAGIISEYADSAIKTERDLAHLTPYFIYANFEIESPFTEQEVELINEALGFDFPTKGVNLPTTTPNCLANTMYNILEAEKPVLQYLLDAVCEETPILARAYYDQDNTVKDSTAIREYELLNYDILSGEYYWPYKK